MRDQTSYTWRGVAGDVENKFHDLELQQLVGWGPTAPTKQRRELLSCLRVASPPVGAGAQPQHAKTECSSACSACSRVFRVFGVFRVFVYVLYRQYKHMDINYVLVIHDKLKMRPATIPLVLRVVSRPLRCCVQCDVHTVHQ